MGIYYYGAHSITFTRLSDNVTKNTWTDLHLVPTSKLFIEPAEPKFKYVNLPLSKNVLDLTRAQAKDILYDASEGSWEFYMDHENENYDENAEGTIHKVVMDYFNGSRFSIVLDDDPDISYMGIVSIESLTAENDYNKVQIHYSINMYGEDDDEDINSEGRIIVPQIGSNIGGDPIGRNTILRDQIVPIVNRAKKVYYAHFDFTGYDTFEKTVDLFDGGGYISDPIAVNENALWPNPTFEDEKYKEEFNFDIKAVWAKSDGKYHKRINRYFDYNGVSIGPFNLEEGTFEHYNFLSVDEKARKLYPKYDIHYTGIDLKIDLDDPYIEYLSSGIWYDRSRPNIIAFPFATAYKITNAKEDKYIGAYFVYGSFTKNRVTTYRWETIDDVYSDPPAIQPHSLELGKKIYKDDTYDYLMVSLKKYEPKNLSKRDGEDKHKYILWSDGYYSTDEYEPYGFNAYGSGKINLSSIDRTASFKNGFNGQYDENVYKRFVKSDLSYLRDEYGFEFDFSKIYLFRKKKHGKGQYKVTISRVQ